MPLDYGKSEKAFKANVRQLIKDGKPTRQALAIAYSIMRGETKKPKEAEQEPCMCERCWQGYEPVPGKKPYSPGSCKKKEG